MTNETIEETFASIIEEKRRIFRATKISIEFFFDEFRPDENDRKQSQREKADGLLSTLKVEFFYRTKTNHSKSLIEMKIDSC